jgi:excisionase family DNA binding protein
MADLAKFLPLHGGMHKKGQSMETSTRFLNVGQAADYLGVSAASLRKWSDEGIVPVYRTPGGQRRFSLADLDEFKRSMRQPSAQVGGGRR